MSLDITVKDVYSKEFISVSREETLSDCLSLFKKGLPPVLLVLDEKGDFEGILARRWIIRSRRLDPATTKVETLMRPAPRVREEDSISRAASLMIENSLRELPVYRGDELVGVITDENIIHGAVMTGWGDTKVEEIMTKNPILIDEEETVGELLNLFRSHNISHAPVTSGGKLVGMVSIQDIIDNFFQPIERPRIGEKIGEKIELINAPVKSIMSSPLITVPPETSLKDAERKMHDHDISSLVVVREETAVGIVTKRDFLEPIAQMEMERPKLTIQFSVKDIELDETQRSLMIEDFESFRNRYQKTLEHGTLFVYIKAHGTTHKGHQLIHCRLHLRTVKGSFHSAAEGWGIGETFRLALDRIERQILRSKEFRYDPEFARMYLRRIYFPSTDF